MPSTLLPLETQGLQTLAALGRKLQTVSTQNVFSLATKILEVMEKTSHVI